MEKLTKRIGKCRKTVVIVIILLTVAFHLGITKRLTVVADDKSMLPEDDPRAIAHDEVNETFAGAEFAMVILHNGD